MTGLLRLQAEDPGVRDLTLRALAYSASIAPDLRLRCRDCGALIAQVGDTPPGVLFTSTWTAPLGSSVEGLDAIPPGVESGRVGRARVDGVIAILTVPPGVMPDYPDLLVRCEQHGDAVLDRAMVLKLWNAAVSNATTPDSKVPLRLPRRAYDVASLNWTPEELQRLRELGGAIETTHSTRTWQFGTPAPLEELQRRLHP